MNDAEHNKPVRITSLPHSNIAISVPANADNNKKIRAVNRIDDNAIVSFNVIVPAIDEKPIISSTDITTPITTQIQCGNFDCFLSFISFPCPSD